MRMPTADSAVLVLGLLALGSSACSDPVTPSGEEPSGAWAPLGDGVATGSLAIAIHQGDLVVGGRFEGPSDGSGIVRWSGGGWQPMGPLQSWLDGANGATIEDLTVHGGSLYAAVRFPAPGMQGGIVVRWVGDAWEEVGDAADPTLRALTVYAGALHAGGNGVSRWDGTDWVRIEGSPLHIYAFGEYEGDLVAGGNFQFAADVPANYIARWDGSTWRPFAEGLARQVHAITVFEGDLVVGGVFGPCGPQVGQPMNRVARWNGSAWAPLGDGLDDPVFEFVVHNGALYAGGTFRGRGHPSECSGTGEPLLRVARWDGTDWQPVGAGLGEPVPEGGSVEAMIVWNGALVASGSFSMSGDAPVRNVARWAD